jgi:hypothetical protein
LSGARARINDSDNDWNGFNGLGTDDGNYNCQLFGFAGMDFPATPPNLKDSRHSSLLG